MNSRHVKRIACPQANWGQREAYFALAMERRLWRGLRSFPGRPCTGASRPFEASKAAVCYVRFKSILLKNSNFGLDHNSEDRWQPQWKFP